MTSPANQKEAVGEKWFRRQFIVGILALLVPFVVAVAPYFLEDVQEQSVEPQDAASSEPSDALEPSETSLPRVEISWLHVSKVALDIPAAFELEIQNTSLSRMSAHDIKVILDFGRAEVDVCGYTPKQSVIVVARDPSYQSLEIVKLRQHEKLYIRCLISSPVFNQISIAGDKIRSDGPMDFQQYQESLSIPRGFWMKFWDDQGRNFVGLLFMIFCLVGGLWLMVRIL